MKSLNWLAACVGWFVIASFIAGTLDLCDFVLTVKPHVVKVPRSTE